MASRKIEDLHAQFQKMVRSLLDQGQQAIQSTGFTFFITDGFRSFEEQTELYSHGRNGDKRQIITNAKAGESAHNFGLAVDLAFQKAGALSYDSTLYAKIYPIARTLGFELGADWTGFVDKPHFEHPQWEKIAKGIDMSEQLDWKGLDPSNLNSLNSAVLTWADVRDGKYVSKEKYEILAEQLKVCQTNLESKTNDTSGNTNDVENGLSDIKRIGNASLFIESVTTDSDGKVTGARYTK